MADKDKKYYWLRLKHDFFKRHDIRIIESMPNGKDYILFYLKLLCESVDHDGTLRFSDAIPYSEQMLATITNTNVDVVRSAIEVFIQLKMMEIMDDGTYYMREVEKMIGSACQDEHTRESTRLRVQAFRERQKQALLEEKRYGNVTCNGEIELEIEIEKDKEIDKKENIKRKKLDGKQPTSPEQIDGETVNVYYEDLELNRAFEDFVAMRKKIKKPLTDRAVSMAKKKLEGLAVVNGVFDTTMAIEILNQSILGSWTGLYPLKQYDGYPKGRGSKIDWSSV